MLKIIRYMIAICFFIIAIMFFKNKTIKIKKRLLKFIPSIFLSLLIFIMPFENLFLKFNTPETAFKYTTNNCDIVKVVKGDQTALVIYRERSSTYATVFTKSGGKMEGTILARQTIIF